MANLLNPWPVPVPSDDLVVKRYLRDLDQPATYFGEGPGGRRERLAKILINLPEEKRKELQASDVKAINGRVRKSEVTYSEGSVELRRARLQIAEYSIQQSNARLDMARIKQLEPLSTRLIPQQDLVERIRNMDNPESYVDEETASSELKTLTSCNFNGDATMVCTSCRSGKCKIWTMPAMDTHTTLRGHQQSANFIQFNPRSASGVSGQLAPSVANLASCSMDGSVILWNLIDETPFCQLSKPQSGWRVTRVRHHPSGNYLASCCSDNSWRLWDLQTETELLVQAGHSDAVFDLAYHPDGSLAGSAGLDTFARMWDLRTGKCVHLFEGHSKGIRSIDFSPNGYHIATGSLDNTVKIWNLRQRRLEYTIPAHLNAVTSVVFEKENGYCLATASFDKSVKFWSTQTWAPIKTLDAYEDKVACLDFSADSNRIISCYGKYLKLWTSDVFL